MGFNLGKFLEITKAIAPIVLGATGVPPALIPLVVHGITLAEAHPGNLSGIEKRQFVLDAVATGVQGVNTVKPGAISEDWPQVVGSGIDTTISAVKAVQNNPPVVVAP